MDTLKALMVFMTTAENGSFSDAARKLGVSPNYTQTRDLLGRSRSGKSASQILIDVSDDKGAARRRIEH